MAVQNRTGSHDVIGTSSYLALEKKPPGSTSLCAWLTKTKFESTKIEKMNAVQTAAKAQPLFGLRAECGADV